MNPGRGALGSLDQIHKDFQRRPETLTDNGQAHMTIPSGAVMQTLEYYWNNGHLNGWGSQVTVLLYVTDGYTGYSADVTSQNSATLSASGIPANYSVYII